MRAVAAIAALLMLAVSARADELEDLPEASLDAGELAREYSAGSVDAIPVWIYVTCEGLAAVAKGRCEDAVAGDAGANPTRLIRAVARVAPECAGGGFRKATSTSEYVCYVTLPVPLYRRLKGCIDDGTCSQSQRVRIFEASWRKVRLHVRCADFFPQRQVDDGAGGTTTFTPCAQTYPPAAFYGVDPDRGEPQP